MTKFTSGFSEKRKQLIILFVVSFVLFLLLVVNGKTIYNKLTYLEYSTLNSDADTYTEIADENQSIHQEFIMPYNIFYGISVKIGTFARDNNSIWKITIAEKDTNRIIVEKDFNASLIKDNQFHLYSFDSNYQVNKGNKYVLIITPVKVSKATSLAFYRSKSSQINETTLLVNQEEIDSDLCIAVYGGNRDLWWIGLALFNVLYLIIMLYRAITVVIHGKKIIYDKLFMSMLCGAVVYLILFSFAISGTFTDENDNMRGGMIIANGGVLYRDYVTQHTPVMYYLCGIFAFLGAGSVQQFRLSYYIFESVIWGALYYRHSEHMGKKKMFLLAVLENVFISSVIMPQGYQILSDGLQGLCTLAILFEFMGYYQDKKLDWIRSIIVSCCIWGSFGSAFISAYALIWVFLSVLVLEIYYLFENKLTIRYIGQRYYKLIVSISVPLICAIGYFKINHSLRRAFEQFFTFNREVYSQYTGGLGENIAQPFINAYQNFFNIIANNFHSIIVAEASNIIILQLFISIAAVAVIIGMIIKKRYVESFLMFNVMCCSATRGYGFHGLAAWYVAILIMVIFSEFTVRKQTAYCSIVGVSCVILFSTYIDSVAKNLLYKQTEISAIDNEIITRTDDNEKILIDAFCNDSLYLCYKNRYPVNRAVYMLPWYMDWYEQDTINDLLSNMPRIVVYDENRNTWGYTYYANAFLQELKTYYVRLSDNADDGWKYYIWTKK